jgi:formyltetrahydrofolate deformylase
MTQNANRKWILTAQCPDTAGIQAATATFLHESGAFLEDVASFGDPDTNRYFNRIVFRSSGAGALDISAIRTGFAAVAAKLSMTWSIDPADRPCPAVILVSRTGHCLKALLHAWQDGLVPIDIKAVVSNHDDLRAYVEWHELPFHFLPVTPELKMEQEAGVLRILQQANAELVVLARYMQILSNGLAAKLAGRCINIHHSFLPGFKGAKPYDQAYRRGVKIIGATAHYVTGDLDEGPIIEQAVERVDHTASPDELAAIGTVIESTVLTRAVRWHAERRVLLNDRKTVVFR